MSGVILNYLLALGIVMAILLVAWAAQTLYDEFKLVGK
jgi:hypothetical protein